MEYEAMLYYKGLIQMRKSYSIFTDATAQITNVEELGSGILAVTFDDGNGGQALVVINPHNTALPYTLDGQWNLLVDDTRSGSEVLEQQTGTVTLKGISIRIYVNDALLQ